MISYSFMICMIVFFLIMNNLCRYSIGFISWPLSWRRGWPRTEKWWAICGCVIFNLSVITAVIPASSNWFHITVTYSKCAWVSPQFVSFLTQPQNGRVAKLLTVGVRQLGDKRASSFSRCCALVRYEATKLSSDSFAIIKSLNTAGNHQAAW